MIELPTYDPVAVMPMRNQLLNIGFSELLTEDDVENVLNTSFDPNQDDTVLIVINSVCGCAAGSARPGVALALQNSHIPGKLYSVFAGMEKAAVRKFREFLEPNPPSSPGVALIKQGKLVFFMPRLAIEGSDAVGIAEKLVDEFDKHCQTDGPSISHEEFSKLDMRKMCGSKLPLFAQ
jgi:putative YphP/YqiW family bacilliredoxin